MNEEITRRSLLQSSLLTASSLTLGTSLLSGCHQEASPITGELLRPNLELGHLIRNGINNYAGIKRINDIPIVIVGAGIAGLSAGWHLKRQGIVNFKILELEQQPGGTSLAGQSSLTAFPWGAHYVPMPDENNPLLLSLFAEMGAVVKDPHGSYLPAEHVGCRPPQERLFVDGAWHEGLYPSSIATKTDLAEWHDFQQRMISWSKWRDGDNKPAFCLPLELSSQHPDVVALDQLSAGDWLHQQNFTSPLLQWMIDYCCRDDYGLKAAQTSAWAMHFYFASRLKKADSQESTLLTWPAGNGAIINYLKDQLQEHLLTGHALTRIDYDPKDTQSQLNLFVSKTATQKYVEVHAEHMIYAGPQFLLPYLWRDIPDSRREQIKKFQYGSWVVANIHLKDRPQEVGYPLSWDNVIYQSPSLGFVCATHQQGSDYGPTVWTWYYPMCGDDPAAQRHQLQKSTRDDWVKLLLNDLKPVYPLIESLIEKIDVMQWGHAMIQPRPGFMFSDARKNASQPIGNISFANTDLSGVALMEEAFYHGTKAANEIMEKMKK